MNVEQTVALEARVRRHAALADATRLRLVDLLALGDRSASELGAALSLRSNLLAHHLRVLDDAGVIRRRRSEGDARRTYVSLVQPALAAVEGMPFPPPARVVFVCTANTARSHLAAALWRDRSLVAATSAGTEPGERIAAGALAAAARHGLDLPEVAPRHVSGTLAPGDLVITVCDRAHEELADQGWTHWSIPDPVPTGTDAAFEEALEALEAKVGALAPAL